MPEGNLAQDELGVADDHRMPGIGAALVAHDQVGPLGQHVHQLALSFVAPLRPDDHHTGGPAVEHVGSRLKQEKPLAGLLHPRANVSQAAQRSIHRDRLPPRSAASSESRLGTSAGVWITAACSR